jgi:glutamate formiminotransferase
VYIELPAAFFVLQLTAAVLSVAEAALSVLDLRSHAADHPRLGVLDHVSLHPLGQQATLQQAADAATSLGQQLAAAPFALPVYYYGAAHPAGRRLAEIRRQLGEQCWSYLPACVLHAVVGPPQVWAGCNFTQLREVCAFCLHGCTCVPADHAPA